MMQVSPVKASLLGLLTWLIPFAASIPFYSRDGELVIPVGVFKSLMIVIGSAVGAWLLVSMFRHRATSRRAGLAVGLLWLGINLGLDLLVLVPLTKMSLSSYFGEIGLRYLVIPIMSVALAVVAHDSSSGRAQAAS